MSGVSPGSAMQRRERDGARAVRAGNLDRRIERDQRLGEIARIGRDAVFADAEHRMAAD